MAESAWVAVAFLVILLLLVIAGVAMSWYRGRNPAGVPDAALTPAVAPLGPAGYAPGMAGGGAPLCGGCACGPACRCAQNALTEMALWDDHFYLTRQYLRAVKAGDPCAPADRAALLANQRQLGDAWGARVGSRAAGRELAALLTEHIAIAEKIALAAAVQNHAEVARQQAAWQANAQQIAALYGRYGYDAQVVCVHMMHHLETTTAELLAMLAGDCAGSRRAGEAALVAMREMALYLGGVPAYNQPGAQHTGSKRSKRKHH